MHPFQKLLNEYCPQGVEFRALGEVCNVLPKEGLKKSQLTETGFPVINSSRDFFGFYPKFNNEGNAVVITSHGVNAGFVHFMTQRFWAGALCYPYRVKNENELLTKFLFYFLNAQNKKIRKFVLDGGIPYINRKDLDTLQIPVPPLPVQAQIVECLDSFAALVDNLQKEHDLRQKQFAHYREELLKPEALEKRAAAPVPRKALGEICNSLPKQILKTTQLLPEGFPVINAGRELYGYFSDFNNEGNALTIASRGEYAGFISFMDSRFWAGALCYPYRSKNENEVLTKFIFYYLKNIERDIMKKLVARGSIPAINKGDTDKIKIHVPPLKIQTEIVECLDSFAALSDNLQKEIALRQKQLEHYREELLTFSPKS